MQVFYERYQTLIIIEKNWWFLAFNKIKFFKPDLPNQLSWSSTAPVDLTLVIFQSCFLPLNLTNFVISYLDKAITFKVLYDQKDNFQYVKWEKHMKTE